MSLSGFLAGWFAVFLRESTVKYLQGLYASGIKFYLLNVIDKSVDNP